MHLHIKYKKSSQRGKQFYHDLENIEEPGKGLISGRTCTTCRESPGGKKVLKCHCCNKNFHASCLVRPITDEVTTCLQENPSLWWVCMPCTRKSANESDGELFDKDEVESECAITMNQVEDAIEKKIAELEYNILKHMSEIIKTAQPSSPHNLNTVSVNDPTCVQVNKKRKRSNNENNHATSYAEVTAGFPSSNTEISNTVVNSPQSDKSSVLILRKAEGCNIELSDHKQWLETRHTISRKLSTVKTSFIKKNEDGKIKIGFPDTDAKNNAKELLTEDSNFKFSVNEPKKQLPKLTVQNVPLDEVEQDWISTEAPHDQKAWKNVFRESILKKNEGIAMLVNNGSVLEVVYIKKLRTSYTVALKVSPDVRLHIKNKCSSKLFVFSARCKTFDRCHFVQCFNCQEVGHIASKCPATTPTCMFCSAAHKTSDCPDHVRNDKNKHKCANCSKAKSNDFRDKSSTHHSSSYNCPILSTVRQWIMKNTELDPKN